jgi:hypothetical protein
MADSSLHSTLSGALTSQTMSMGDASQQHSQQHPQQHPQQHQGGDTIGVQPQQAVAPANPETPVKRRPGRPKGSGKKQLEGNGEPKIKRPVGRPRKDGLPAGSVGPKKPARPRKRAPGDFAAAVPGGALMPPYAVLNSVITCSTIAELSSGCTVWRCRSMAIDLGSHGVTEAPCTFRCGFPHRPQP